MTPSKNKPLLKIYPKTGAYLLVALVQSQMEPPEPIKEKFIPFLPEPKKQRKWKK